jgi:arylsulfatase A-like enzyme
LPQPNLLFLYTDEQRFDTLAAYGNRRIQTPNLDRLAVQSTVFERAYVTQAVCTPSRSSLLTGLWPHTNGCVANNIPLRRETRCLPELLERGKWFCAHHGKWHLGDEIYAQHGFVEWSATEDTYHAYYSPERNQADRSPYHHYLIAHGIEPAPHPELPPEIASRFFRPQIHRLPEEHSRPLFLAREACRFLRENRARPFVLYVNFLEPHMPFHSCRDGQYRPANVELRKNSRHELSAEFSLRARMAARKYRAGGFEGQALADERGWRELTARYWGMVSLVDTACGKVFETLHELGLDESTVIVFTSDHGDMMASHGLLGKGVQFEESARVPFLLRLPGQTRGRRVAGPVSQIDIVPTLLDLLGQPASPALPGKSLRPHLEGSAAREGEDVFLEWIKDPLAGKELKKLPAVLEGLCTLEEANRAIKENIRTVVTADGWKFNWSSIGQDELFDLNADPLETANLARRPEQSARVRGLAARIRRWQDAMQDTLALPLQ